MGNSMQVESFDVGKLPMAFLQTMLERYAGKDERIVVGPGVGEDAVVLDMGEHYLVAKTDPITFATDEIGWYVVNVNANDVASMGATPSWLLITLLLPEGASDEARVEAIFAEVHRACETLGITLCGGHTEITYGLDRPIAVGFMLGEMEKSALVRTSGAEAGDHLLLTKGIAIEGTAVLAREMGDRLERVVGTDVVSRARHFLKEPGISVVRDAQVVCRVGQPHAMHDPTEGGLATGLWEMALASGKRLVVDPDLLHLFPETAAFCQALDLDPLGILASGALLVSCAPSESAVMLEALAGEGIEATQIGKVLDGPASVYLAAGDGWTPMPTFERDELLRVLA
jgi:hydrogenase maturation factor